MGEEKGVRPKDISGRGSGGGECVVTKPCPATSEPSEEYEPDSSLTSSEKRLSGDSLPTAPAPAPVTVAMPTVPAAVAMPTVPTVPGATECPPGSGPGHGGVKSEVREPCTLDGSLKWKVRPVTGLWPVGLGASGVRQGEALAEPYWASEASAERSAHSDSCGRKPDDDDDGGRADEVSSGGAA